MAARRRRNRPTKLTPALQDVIVQAVSQGISVAQAGLLAGVGLRTAEEWVRRGEGVDDRPATPLYVAFAEAIARAKAQDEARRVLRITQAAQGGLVVSEKTTTKGATGEVMREVKYTSPEWQADAWFLERTIPERYARHERLDLHLTIQQIAARVAAQYGLTPEAILAEAQLLLEEADRGGPAH